MEFVLRLAGLELSIVLGRQEPAVDGDSYGLTTTDCSFGFSPDPVFPDLIWDEE